MKITLPVEVIPIMDNTVKIIGFKSRENLVEVAAKRLLDRYRILFKSANIYGGAEDLEKTVEEAE